MHLFSCNWKIFY